MRKLALSLFVALVTLLPVVAVTAPADAASRHTWSRLARCESGGRWHVNTGNGYFGGLQISSGTWHAFGGRTYARTAARASRHQQIRVAERIKRHQGWRAWPSCSRRIGVR